MSNYSEKLKDPRWQRKRLEVLNRDNFQCYHCFSKEKTLHVHHKYYSPGKNVWEYPIEALVTLCSECHHDEEEGLKQEATLLIQVLKEAGFGSFDFSMLADVFKKIKNNQQECYNKYEALNQLIILEEHGYDFQTQIFNAFDGISKIINNEKAF